MRAANSHSEPSQTNSSPTTSRWSRWASPVWTRITLGAIIAFSLFFGVFRLNQLGYANLYYAAAVRSMTQSWHAFFFASFDRAGFVSVDKPPFGLWVQAIFARMLGFHGWSIMLPQVLAATGSVLVIYMIVSRVFGKVPGLIAAGTLAIAPVTVAASRNNTSDTLLVFILLLAAWAVVISLERNSVKMFSLGMVLVGVGFNVKMLEAYLVLPALLLAWVLAPAPMRSPSAVSSNTGTSSAQGAVATRRSWWNRIGGLFAGGISLIVVSFSWATVVQLTPATDRPYIASSPDNNIFNLIFQYNGVARLLPHGWTIFGIANGPTPANSHAALTNFSGENGQAGLFRLLNPNLGGQIGWLLPLAFMGLWTAWGVTRWWKVDRVRLSLVIWGGWFLTAAMFFSVAGFYHRYYLSMLSPAVAALAGIGLVALWRARAAGRWRTWLFPIALVATAAVQIRILQQYPVWKDRLVPAIVVLLAIAMIGLSGAPLLHVRRLTGSSTAARIFATAGLIAILVSPAAWSVMTSVDASTGNDVPAAGPTVVRLPHANSVAALLENGKDGVTVGTSSLSNAGFSTIKPTHKRTNKYGSKSNPSTVLHSPTGVLNSNAQISTSTTSSESPGGNGSASRESTEGLGAYLLAHQGNAEFLVAVRKAQEGWGIILQTGGAVMDLGGYTGLDNVLSLTNFKTMVADGQVRYALVGAVSSHKHGGDETIGTWVTETCQIVPTATYESGSTGKSPTEDPGHMLYDCSSHATKARLSGSSKPNRSWWSVT